MARMTQALKAMPARQLHLVGGGLLLVLAACLWTVALRAPLAQLRTVRTEQQRLEAGGADLAMLTAQVAHSDAAIEVLSARLGMGAAHPAPAQLLVALVGDANRLALVHGINVTAVTPAPEARTLGFDQVGFELEATGSYTRLLDWMAAMEAEQANIAIAGFEMQPAKAPGQIQLKIRIAAYRPLEGTP